MWLSFKILTFKMLLLKWKYYIFVKTKIDRIYFRQNFKNKTNAFFS